MKNSYFRLTLLLSVIVLVLSQISFAFGGTQAGKKYILAASQWGAAQINAVAAAGGKILSSHRDAGVATVISNNPNFLDQMFASGTITAGDESEMVELKQPNLPPQPPVEPQNDGFYNMQWNIRAIHAPEAWATGVNGAGVRVAVVDGGIYSAHQDLDNNLDFVHSRSFVYGFDDDGNYFEVPWNEDIGTLWHGTHVAGIIAAEDNSIGTIGVAPKATIISVKVLHGNFGSTDAILNGIVYAATPISEGGAGADIINLSLGNYYQRDRGRYRKYGYYYIYQQILNYVRNKGVLVVAAIGNDAIDWDQYPNGTGPLPAGGPHVIGVSATGPSGFAVNWPNGATDFQAFASYSNFGTKLVDIAAPGGDGRYPSGSVCSIPRTTGVGVVTASCRTFDLVFSTVRGSGPGNFYNWAGGTSMAAPHVAGVAALIKQRYPKMPVDMIKNKLLNTADDFGPIGNDPFYGRGFLNAYRAVTQ